MGLSPVEGKIEGVQCILDCHLQIFHAKAFSSKSHQTDTLFINQVLILFHLCLTNPVFIKYFKKCSLVFINFLLLFLLVCVFSITVCNVFQLL